LPPEAALAARHGCQVDLTRCAPSSAARPPQHIALPSNRRYRVGLFQLSSESPTLPWLLNRKCAGGLRSLTHRGRNGRTRRPRARVDRVEFRPHRRSHRRRPNIRVFRREVHNSSPKRGRHEVHDHCVGAAHFLRAQCRNSAITGSSTSRFTIPSRHRRCGNHRHEPRLLRRSLDKGTADYINCPMNREEYDRFLDALLAAKPPNRKTGKIDYFEGCLPIEILAAVAAILCASAP